MGIVFGMELRNRDIGSFEIGIFEITGHVHPLRDPKIDS